MDAKIVVFVVVSVFAFSSVSTVAEVPAHCYELPRPVFSDGVQKWGFLPKKGKCVPYRWDADVSGKNSFDTEKKCLDTCLPDGFKNYTLSEGVCICRCPKCDHNDNKPNKETVAPAKPQAKPEPSYENISPIFQQLMEAQARA